MSELTTSLPTLQQRLARTAAGVRSTALRTAWFQLVWRWLALLGGLFLLDLLFAVPVWLRWLALLGQVGFVAVSVAQTLSLGRRFASDEQWAARVVEQSHPELDNALINAVQFGRSLRSAPEAQAALMRREMARAEQAAAALPAAEEIGRDAERRAFRALLAAVGVWALVAVGFSSGFLAVTPRLFLPWLDDLTPPYSPTRFEVRPPGATLRYGESLGVIVTVSGPLPDEVSLMTRTATTPWRKVALENTETGHYAVTLAALQEDTWYFAQGGGSRSARYRVHVVSPPKVDSLRVTYSYPEYTHKSPATEAVGETGIHGLPHTGAALEVVSNRRLFQGTWEVRTVDGNHQSLLLEIDPRNPIRGTVKFPLIRPGDFQLGLTSEEGLKTPDASHGKIVIEPDQRPNVWFSQPGQDLLVTADMRVLLHVEAEDDHAVERVVVHRLINDLGDSPREFPSAPPAAHVSHTLPLDLGELGVRPGDQIRYYATAYDNEPQRPNLGETEPFRIKVVTPEEYEKALQERTAEEVTSQARDFASAVRDLAERQEKLAQKMEQLQKQLAAHPGDAKLQKELEAAKAEQKSLQEEARKLAQLMRDYGQSPSSSDLERALKKAIGQMASALGASASGPMQQAQGSSPSSSAVAAREAARRIQSLNRKMQQSVQQALEHLDKAMPLYADMDRFLALVDRQGQLVLQAREFQDRTNLSRADKLRMEGIQAEQTRIREELKQLQEDLRRHAEDAEQFFPKAAASARKIAAEIDQRGIPDTMHQADDRFRQWNGPDALDRAQEALHKLEAMIHECQGGQGNCEGELDIVLSRSLGQSGLGHSLSQLSPGHGMGVGSGDGQGLGNGRGGMQGGKNGQGGGYAVRTAKAYIPGSTASLGNGGSEKHHSRSPFSNRPAALAPEDVEVMRSPARKPTAAPDGSGNGYPAEYRKLVGEYFKAVAESGR